MKVRGRIDGRLVITPTTDEQMKMQEMRDEGLSVRTCGDGKMLRCAQNDRWKKCGEGQRPLLRRSGRRGGGKLESDSFGDEEIE